MANDEKKLIDKEKLLRELGFVCAFLPCGVKSTEDELRKWIEKQPEISLETKTSDKDVPDINVGKWIPIASGCLPKIPKNFYAVKCLVTSMDYLEPFEAYWEGRFWYDNNFENVKNVIAWCKPEPYKGE